MPVVGVLALQGSFREHIEMLERLDVQTREVRLPRELASLDGLIIPGGESTTIGKLLVAYSLAEELRGMALKGFPIWGTCAGMILLAKDIGRNSQPLLGVMDVKVRRNAFGRQRESFETELTIAELGPEPFHAIFIRAPWVESVGAGVRELARLDSGAIVAARQNNLLVTAFHPELTDDVRFHRYFLNLVESHRKQ